MKNIDSKTLKIIFEGIDLHYKISNNQDETLDSVDYEPSKEGVTRRQFVFHFKSCDLITYYENYTLIYFERRLKNE